MTKTIGKTYQSKDVEKHWYEQWLNWGLFTPDRTASSKDTYTIVIPPPNVTGVLHMGHALNVTLQDILVRWNRMNGKTVLWVPGTDHAGIATQNVVERSLKAEGLTKEAIGRKAFIEKVWEWKSFHGGTISEQLKKLGASCDWSREAFTMDASLSLAVRRCFYELYQKDLLYRGAYMTNSCPHCRTVLSDEECERKLVDGHLYHILYPLKNKEAFIEIATTRPETLFGDVAIAKNPNDDRHGDLSGLSVRIPLIDREIPIIDDTYVDTDFGTGLVKITPSHDPNDCLLGQKHQLDFIEVMTVDGKMKNTGLYDGCDRFECRERLVSDLKKNGFLAKAETYQHQVGHCYRCSTVVEPRISEQWFVRMDRFAQRALEAQKKKDIVFYPKRWEKVYTHWLENSRDWCISRQIWWGHRIPVWYCEDCSEKIVEMEDPSQCPSCKSPKIVQDPDVLDTWFSSWLWPLTVLGWPEKKEDWTTFYPTQTLVTGADILYFWVARMIMAGLEFSGEVPFHKIYLHGIIRDNTGRKMSKSLKNVIDPLTIIKEFSADSLRFSLILLSPSGQDIRISKDTFLIGHHFSNKIWNVFRYINLSCDNACIFPSSIPSMDDLLSQWIVSRLMSVTHSVNLALKDFRFQEAGKALYEFIWHDFCDWYLELVKDSISQAKVQHFTVAVFEKILRILHPLMPFITEDLWQKLPIQREDKSIMISQWPSVNRSQIDEGVEKQFSLLKQFVQSLRSARKDLSLPFSQKFDIVIVSEQRAVQDQILCLEDTLKKIAGLSSLVFLSSFEPSQCRVLVFDYGHVYIQLAGIVDIEKERLRLNTLLEKTLKDLAHFDKKFSNPVFMKKAPPDVIEKDLQKKDSLEKMRKNIESQIDCL